MPRKYTRIIDEVNSVKQSLSYLTYVDLIYKNGEYHFDRVRKKSTKIPNLPEDRDSLLWKILAKKKHQTPKSLFEIYQNALKFPLKKKIKKQQKKVVLQKYKRK